MRHLLNTRGSALTACNLTAVLRRELTEALHEVTCPSCKAELINRGVCPECGEEKLAWGFYAPDASFYLGCGYCSETLVSGIDVGMVLAALNEHRWRP